MSGLFWQGDDGQVFGVDPAPIDISIPLDFAGAQPSCFDAPRAAAEPMAAGAFVGDTRAGGSCNGQTLRLTPHGNGTHTECVGHVVDPPGSAGPAIGRLATTAWVPAALLTVEPVRIAAGDDQGLPDNSTLDDLVISRQALARAWRDAEDLPRARGGALVVRTRPNPPGKRWRSHDPADPPPFFTQEAMAWTVERRFEHLLIDAPSVDRLDDGGALASHRVFWGLAPGSRRYDEARRPTATITELIYVPDQVADGLYLLCLQLPHFVSDAAPSRPLLFRLEPR